MTKRLVGLLAAVLLSGAGGAFAQDTLMMKIVSFTGQIQIKTPDGSVIGVVPGAPIPNIPPGAEVQVLSGDAVFQTGQAVVKANAGDAFSFTSGAPGQAWITSMGDKSELQVSVGKTEAVVAKQNSIAIGMAEKGPVQIQSIVGDIPVTSDGKATTLAKGQTMNAVIPGAVPAVPAQPTVKPAAPATPAKAVAKAPEPDAQEFQPVAPMPPPPPPNPVQEAQTASPSAP